MSQVTIVIDAGPGEVRGAMLRDGAVWDVVHHRAAAPSLVGAVYRGRVRRVDPGLNGAFVDIGIDAEAYLRARDASEPGQRAARNARIAARVHEGARIDVRVVADGFAGKGPRVARVQARAGDAPVPSRLEAPPPAVALILERFARDDPAGVICGDAATRNAARAWAERNRPALAGRIAREGGDIFAEHGVEDAIAAALERRVRLADGGELVFDVAEAMCVVDVNSSRNAGRPGRAARDVNLGAMPEIARQLRLRNIAGAVVIDALVMRARDDRSRVLASLRNALRGDPGACHVLGITNLGLIEMTRTRTGATLADRMLAPSPAPGLSADAVAYEALRAVVRASSPSAGGRRLLAGPAVAEALCGRLRAARDSAAQTVGRLDIVSETDRATDSFEIVLGSGGSAEGAS